ncbi:hypothetical protein Bca101_020684 [Brassica carinata]
MMYQRQSQDADFRMKEYGSPIVSATAVADVIRSRTEVLLRKTKTAVLPKPIVMRAEYAHSPNLTIIDTPGFLLKAKKGEPETTPDEILSMVKSHWLLLHITFSCSFSRAVWSGALLCGWMQFVRLIQASGGQLSLSPSLIIASRSLMIVVKLIVTSVLVGTLGRTLVLTLWHCQKTGAPSQMMSFVDR